MTGVLLALVAVAAALVAALVIRLRRERAARLRAEERSTRLETEKDEAAKARRRMVGVAAHELRSPVSVILGYYELIADGIYGDLDERGQEALGRIRQAAEQQLRVLEGTVELVSPGRPRDDAIAPVDLGVLAHDALADARTFGLAYSVVIDAGNVQGLPTILADGDRIRRALDMTFAAALKSSPGRRISFRSTPDGSATTFTIAGTGLDPARDDPGGIDGRPLAIATGNALRIAIARRALDTAGSIHLAGEPDAATVALRIVAEPYSPA